MKIKCLNCEHEWTEDVDLKSVVCPSCGFKVEAAKIYKMDDGKVWLSCCCPCTVNKFEVLNR